MPFGQHLAVGVIFRISYQTFLSILALFNQSDLFSS